MTNEEIDKLEGRELDPAFAAAFLGLPFLPAGFGLDNILAALPDEWRISLDSISLSGLGRGVIWISEVMTPALEPKASPYKSKGPTAATALCRAAMKAKAATVGGDDA